MADHPSDEELLAMAGNATGAVAAVLAHVDTCTACGERLAAFRLVRATLAADDGFAPPAATLARAKALFAQAPSASVAERAREMVGAAKRLIGELTFDSWGRLAPGLTGVRGDLGARQLVWMAGDVEVDLQIAPAQADGPWSLLGQVATPEPKSASVALVDEAGAAAARAEADPYGMFELAAPAGRYDLTVTLADAVLVLPGLEVG